MATAVKEGTFAQEVLESETPVIVDFWAEWCGPCHAVAPVLDKIVEERAGEVKLVKVNIDEERELAERYGIVSIPTIVLFKNGEQAAVAVGAKEAGLAQGEKLVKRGVLVELNLSIAVLVEDANQLARRVIAQREASKGAAGNLVHGNRAAAVHVDALEPAGDLQAKDNVRKKTRRRFVTHLGPLVRLNHVVVLSKPALEEGRRRGT